jgi:sigma-B regulation protein RsbU (phosphoserine phosphatase)
MKKPTLLYIPLALLFLFALSVFIAHYSAIFQQHSQAAATVQVPFSLNGEITAVRPEAEAAGLKAGDRIVAINGAEVRDDATYFQAMSALKPGTMNLVVTRKSAIEGERTRHEIAVPVKEIPQDFNYYARIVVGFTTAYLFPTFCVALGFWVAFMRPRDFLAWLLLFVLLGLSSLSFEGYPNRSLLGTYNKIFFSTWALSMMLFGLYFPERLSLDKKVPWLKWILLGPLLFQVFLTILVLLNTFAGIDLITYISPIANLYKNTTLAIALNMVAICVFFASLGYKSGTLENPDARRRLYLMVWGTTIALLPSFSIVIYRVISDREGSFSDLVPFWYALFALLAMMLFPVTMAYVIVVHRALGIGVVVRQGLQYALAQRGVQALQFILLLVIILSAFWIMRNYGENVSSQVAAVAIGLILIPAIQFVAKRLHGWIDRRFFREAYNSEQILTELSEEVRTMVETRPLLETVSQKISESMHVPQIALLLRQGSAFVPAHALGYSVPPEVSFTEGSRAIEKLQKNEPVVVYQDDAESWVNEEAGAEEREDLRELNSQLLLPLGSKEALSGVISLSPKRSEEPYSPNDLRLLKLVAAQTGLALENSRLTEAIVSEASQKERLNRELEIAREVQERLFPQELPPVKGLDYYGACRPALGVGGDYYDFIELPEGRFGIAIGDVSGKGIGASLMMASLQASLRGQALHYKNDLATLMKQVNTLVYEASTSNRYATFFYAQYLPETRMLSYVNAGHNPPFLLRPAGEAFEVLRLEDGGPVVGMLPTMFTNYTQGEIELLPGDLLVGYTDGISEAMNPAEEEWGEDNMLEQLKVCYASAAAEILPFIVERADEFAAGAKQHDDMTMIVVRVV